MRNLEFALGGGGGGFGDAGAGGFARSSILWHRMKKVAAADVGDFFDLESVAGHQLSATEARV